MSVSYNSLKLYKKILTELRGEIDKSYNIVGNFNTSLSKQKITEFILMKKIYNEYEHMCNVVHRKDRIHIYFMTKWNISKFDHLLNQVSLNEI